MSLNRIREWLLDPDAFADVQRDALLTQFISFELLPAIEHVCTPASYRAEIGTGSTAATQHAQRLAEPVMVTEDLASILTELGLNQLQLLTTERATDGHRNRVSPLTRVRQVDQVVKRLCTAVEDIPKRLNNAMSFSLQGQQLNDIEAEWNAIRQFVLANPDTVDHPAEKWLEQYCHEVRTTRRRVADLLVRLAEAYALDRGSDPRTARLELGPNVMAALDPDRRQPTAEAVDAMPVSPEDWETWLAELAHLDPNGLTMWRDYVRFGTLVGLNAVSTFVIAEGQAIRDAHEQVQVLQTHMIEAPPLPPDYARGVRAGQYRLCLDLLRKWLEGDPAAVSATHPSDGPTVDPSGPATERSDWSAEASGVRDLLTEWISAPSAWVRPATGGKTSVLGWVAIAHEAISLIEALPSSHPRLAESQVRQRQRAGAQAHRARLVERLEHARAVVIQLEEAQLKYVRAKEAFDEAERQWFTTSWLEALRNRLRGRAEKLERVQDALEAWYETAPESVEIRNKFVAYSWPVRDPNLQAVGS